MALQIHGISWNLNYRCHTPKNKNSYDICYYLNKNFLTEMHIIIFIFESHCTFTIYSSDHVRHVMCVTY